MKTAIAPRLFKEARALLPIWAVTVLLMLLASYWAKAWERMDYIFTIYGFGSVLLSAASFGNEFNHKTMSFLLSQPMSRRRLWWEKMAVLGGFLFALVALSYLLAALRSSMAMNDTMNDLKPAGFWLLVFAPAILSFCTGPAFTLLTRNIIGGVAMMFLCLALGPLICWWLLPERLEGQELELWIFKFNVIASSCYCGGMFLFGARYFQRFQESDSHATELSLPALLSRPLRWFTFSTPAWLKKQLHFSPGNVLTNLVIKELRLQRPTFLIASFIFVIWLAVIATKAFGKPFAQELLFFPAFGLCLIVPLVSGIVSVAEERSIGLHEWHLALPVSGRRQWYVKVMSTLAINVVLGLLLPWFMLLTLGGLFGLKDAHLHPDVARLLISSNIYILCTAVYASTVAGNSIRALLGASVIFVASFMIATLIIPREAGWAITLVSHHRGRFADFSGVVLRIGLAALFILILEVSLANYRRTLDSIWRPVRQLAFLYAAIGIFMLGLFIFVRI